MKLGKLVESAVKTIKKAKTAKSAAKMKEAVRVATRDNSKMLNQLDNMATINKAAINKKIAKNALSDVTKYKNADKQFLKLVTGEKAHKSAQESAEIFHAQAALEAATGIKARKLAGSSAYQFMSQGNTAKGAALEKALLNSEKSAENAKKLMETKARLMEKYGDKLATQHKIADTKARLLEKYADKIGK